MKERIENYPLHDSIRGYFGFELYKAMEKNKDIVLLTGDLGYGMLTPHQEDFPDRFINCGASEVTMMGMAVGMAQEGRIPFVYSITPFLLFRPAEVIRNYIHGEKIPVKLVGSGFENDYLHDGPSHANYDDKQLLKIFNNIAGCWPQTKEEMAEVVDWAVNNGEPTYINLRR